MSMSAARSILIVDDEAGIRLVMRRQLAALGHTVLEADDAVEALARIRADPGSVHLVLADVVMPRMNGTELAAALMVECPDLPVILMSAYTPAGLVRVGVNRSVVPVLMKPFSTDQLVELIEVALDLPGKRRRTSRPSPTA
jgi:two-component system cell cycle sensor histidine kinase/response regulator CckA